MPQNNRRHFSATGKTFAVMHITRISFQFISMFYFLLKTIVSQEIDLNAMGKMEDTQINTDELLRQIFFVILLAAAGYDLVKFARDLPNIIENTGNDLNDAYHSAKFSIEGAAKHCKEVTKIMSEVASDACFFGKAALKSSVAKQVVAVNRTENFHNKEGNVEMKRTRSNSL